ncbi:MAG: YaeQ family protein [Burkholderiales bacterium]
MSVVSIRAFHLALHRHVYGDHALIFAPHPSGADERMVARVLAVALHADCQSGCRAACGRIRCGARRPGRTRDAASMHGADGQIGINTERQRPVARTVQMTPA